MLRGINNIADTDFLYWFLTQDHITKHLHSIAEDNTTTHQAIRPRDLEAIRLLLPSLSGQRAIASVLRTLDDKIDLNRRMSQTLEGMARALFKSWFVDFDPVRAKMDGRWKRGGSLPGLPDLKIQYMTSYMPVSTMINYVVHRHFHRKVGPVPVCMLATTFGI